MISNKECIYHNVFLTRTMFVAYFVEIYSVVFFPALHTDRNRGNYFVKEPLFEVREHKNGYCHLNLNLYVKSKKAVLAVTVQSGGGEIIRMI